MSAPIVVRSSLISPRHLVDTHESTYLSRPIKWFRAETLGVKDRTIRAIAAIALALLMSLTLIGIPLVILAAIEWRAQERKVPEPMVSIQVDIGHVIPSIQGLTEKQKEFFMNPSEEFLQRLNRDLRGKVTEFPNKKAAMLYQNAKILAYILVQCDMEREITLEDENRPEFRKCLFTNFDVIYRYFLDHEEPPPASFFND